MKKEAQEKNRRIWDIISKEDKKRLQDCLSNVELKFGMNSETSLNALLCELKEKYDAKNNCMYCGQYHRGRYGLCKTCKTQLLRTKNIDMGEEEIEKYSDAVNPENLHWAFVDIENAQRIARLFTPGRKFSWTQMQTVGQEFSKLKLKLEQTMDIKEHRYCLVCGKTNRSSKGLCSECRAYIREHGCTKPMREGDYKAISSVIGAVSQLSRATGEQSSELYPLVKIR